MSWDQIAGQPVAVRLLKNSLRTGRVAHAYLFHGPEGTGKRKAALNLAKALNCQSGARPGIPGNSPVPGSADDACEKCLSCRKIEGGNHPDVHLVAPAGAYHRIEAMRELQKSVWLRPNEGRYHIILLEEADRLRDEAANSLLKILEEPPGLAVFILLTSNPAALLPTITSRCQPVSFRPLPEAVVVEHLVSQSGQDPEKAKMLAALAGGSLGRALELAQSKDLARLKDEADRLANEIWNLDAVRIMELAEALDKRKQEIPTLLDFLALEIRDRILGAHRESPGALGHAPPGNLDKYLAAVEAIEGTRLNLSKNANPRLSLEALFFKVAKQST